MAVSDDAKEPYSLQILKLILEDLQKNHGITPQEAINNLSSKKTQTKLQVPLSIFVQQITVLEAVIKYLKEKYGLRITDIARMLNRNPRSVWGSYRRTQKKHPLSLPEDPKSLLISIDEFCSPTFSPSESLVMHLKDAHNMRFSDIAGILHRDSRTIWALYSNASRKKLKGERK